MTKARKHAETASSLSFSPDELCILSDALRLAVEELGKACEVAERTSPQSPLIERWRIHAESMIDLRTRIDS